MESILSRIAKLHELASRPGTPAEAEAAAAKVQTLLLKHNLSLADVETHASGLGEVSMMTLPAQDSIWRAKLLGVVANAHLCRAVRTHDVMGLPETFSILGHAHNLRVVQSVYPWLCQLVPNMALKASADHVSETHRIGIQTWLHSFRLGMIDGIADAYAKARADLNDETGLVPIDDAVQQALEDAFPDAMPHRPGGEADIGAYQAGVAAGRNVNTDTQLGGDDARKLDHAAHDSRPY